MEHDTGKRLSGVKGHSSSDLHFNICVILYDAKRVTRRKSTTDDKS